ncbi:MAG: PDZ domain-containing protein [Candidatus Syntrophosphaera sp.]|nr:PDZ domain-containing protein [Candidatus Syntrophosphaera sp.]
MKRTALTIIALTVLLTLAFAQNWTEEDSDIRIITRTMTAPASEVYFGIFVDDLSDAKAEEIGYEYPYGILISSVVENSPAWENGMRKGDIIMEVEGQEVTDRGEFDRIRGYLKPGDTVWVRTWSKGTVRDFEMTMQPRPEITVTRGSGPKKLSPGYGGGSWLPYWTMLNVDDPNYIIASLGFEADAVTENGVFMQGGGGKFHVGKGIFIGGLGAAYEYKEDKADSRQSLRYNATFAGVTFDKRVPFSKNFIGSLGLMIGGGGHEVYYSYTNTVIDWDNLIEVNSNSYRINKEYFVLQPRAELMYRLLSWFALRAEVGYLYGIPTYNGWYLTDNNNHNYKITGSPKTAFQGLTISVGPWFGF